MNEKKLLIIGSTGQLGTDMCREAKKAGYEVTGVDFPEIDISDRRSVEHHISISKPSLIINCAVRCEAQSMFSMSTILPNRKATGSCCGSWIAC